MSEHFKPSKAQVYYAYLVGTNLKKVTQLEIADRIGVCTETISRWKQRPGFNEWFKEELIKYQGGIENFLESIAFKNVDEFKFFDFLAKRHGLIDQEGNGSEPRLVIDLSGKVVPKEDEDAK